MVTWLQCQHRKSGARRSLEQARLIVPVISASVNRGRVTETSSIASSLHTEAHTYAHRRTDRQTDTCTCTPHMYTLERKRVMTEPPVPHFWGTPNATVAQESGLTPSKMFFSLLYVTSPRTNVGMWKNYLKVRSLLLRGL